MWQCEKCGINIDGADSCWKCGTSRGETSHVSDTGDFKSAKEGSVNSESSSGYTSTYGTTRFIAQFVSVFGWVVVCISAIILLVSLVESIGSYGSLALMGLFPAFAGIISGLLLVMAGQFTRATVDTADNTGQILAIMKRPK
jgi:hypothetical protein